MQLDLRRYFFRVFINLGNNKKSERVHHFAGKTWAQALERLTVWLDSKGLYGYEIEDIKWVNPIHANEVYSQLQEELDQRTGNKTPHKPKSF